jgi:mannitol/fructose-specific phosphotransferase system IIA component (Ntr-type)
MDLASLLDPKVVKVPVESVTSDEVIAELVELLVRAGKLKGRDAALDALYEREGKGTTGIGGTVAVPHARHAELKDNVLAVGIAREGIDFDAIDEEPVRVVFLVLGAADKPGQTIETLADIGTLSQMADVRERLINAGDAAEVIQIIRQAQLSE